MYYLPGQYLILVLSTHLAKTLVPTLKTNLSLVGLTSLDSTLWTTSLDGNIGDAERDLDKFIKQTFFSFRGEIHKTF